MSDRCRLNFWISDDDDEDVFEYLSSAPDKNRSRRAKKLMRIGMRAIQMRSEEKCHKTVRKVAVLDTPADTVASGAVLPGTAVESKVTMASSDVTVGKMTILKNRFVDLPAVDESGNTPGLAVGELDV